MAISVVVGPVRFSYVSLLEKSEGLDNELQYSAVLMFPKSDKALVAKVHLAFKKATDAAVAKGLFKKNMVKNVTLPWRDGDDEEDRGSKGKEFDGFFWMNVKNKRNQPGIVGPDRQPIMDEDEIYSGMWGYADIALSPYDYKGKKGIGAYLNNVMKTKDDERLDGRQSAEDAFADIEPLDELE